jgi:hypothetical protein
MRVLFVSALLALAMLGGSCDDDKGDSGSDRGTSTSDTTSTYCTIAAKTLELVAERFREGHSARRIIEEYGGGLDKACEVAVTAWVNRPDEAVNIGITDPSGTMLDERVSQATLLDLAPESPMTGEPSCNNYALELLRDRCRAQALDELRRILDEQSGGP